MKLAVRTSVIAVGFVLLAFVPPAAAWESDVHYGLTKWLAMKAGFDEGSATRIAIANLNADNSLFGDAVGIMVVSCATDDAVGAGHVHDFHFPSEFTVRNPPDKRRVEAGRVYEKGKLAPAPALKDFSDQGQLREFGQYLHAFQDSWSHQGKPDVPLFCKSELGWGHPLKRGGWSCHLADQTYYWSKGYGKTDDVIPMAFGTYKLLADISPKKPEDWSTLESQVADFAKARSKWEKDDWFVKVGFADRDFLRGISLPPCADRKECAGRWPYTLQRLIDAWPRVVEQNRRRPKSQAGSDVPARVTNVVGTFVRGLLNQKKDELTSLIDQAPAIATLSRVYRINGSCPALYEKLMPEMLLAGFVVGSGARQPKEYCELVAQSSGDKPMSCDEILQVLQQQPDPVGTDIRQLVEKLGGVPPYIIEAVASSDVYLAFVRFVHLPRDRLMLTVDRSDNPKITGFMWIPDQ